MLVKKEETSVSSAALVSGNDLPHKIWIQDSLQVTYKAATTQMVVVAMAVF